MIRIKNPFPPRLPNEYQEVEYIESSGTQYIDTGFTPNQDSSIEMTVKFTDLTINETLYCSREGQGTNTLTCFKAKSAVRVDHGSTKQTLSNFTLDTSTKYIFYANKNKFYVNEELKHTFTSVTVEPLDTWLLMVARINGASYTNYSKYKLYSCKIWDNDVLIRNFVPCINSIGVAGLYDLVNDIFYTNAGTGIFLIGTEVNRRDVNVHPMVGGKKLLARYVGDKLIYKAKKNFRFVCVGASGKSYYSTDGLSWAAMSGLNTVTYEGVTYGKDRFVCVGNSGSSYYSTDGLTWTSMTGLTSKSFTSVAYGNGVFVCVGADGYSYYSTNGTSWTAITRLASDYIYGVTYGNDRFVCVGEGGLIYYSTTGKKWTKASGPYVTSLNSVTYGDGKFICVGTQGKSYYSTDNGATWTSMSGLSTSSSYSSVTYGDGRFVCTGSAGRSYYSTNGTSWKAMSGLTAKDAYGDLSYDGVTYGDDRFVCVGINGYSFYSTDGLTWNAMSGLPNSTSADFYEVTYAEI